MSEEYIEEGINGQWTDWKFEAENYKKMFEYLQQENKLLKEVIEEVREVIDTYKYVENDDGMYEPILDGYDIQKLLQILDKVK